MVEVMNADILSFIKEHQLPTAFPLYNEGHLCEIAVNCFCEQYTTSYEFNDVINKFHIFFYVGLDIHASLK